MYHVKFFDVWLNNDEYIQEKDSEAARGSNWYLFYKNIKQQNSYV